VLKDSPPATIENAQPVQVKYDNIFLPDSKGKTAFNLIRSDTAANPTTLISEQSFDPFGWCRSRLAILPIDTIARMFSNGVEFQSAHDLPNLRLTVLAVQSTANNRLTDIS
jgi:hypothetical protein